MEKIRGERQKHEQKEVADADLLPRVPISFLPGPLRPETPLQNTGNFLHYSVDPFCTTTNPQTHLLNGKAMPPPLQPQRREHGQGTNMRQDEPVPGKRTPIALPSPAQWVEEG